MTLRGFLRGTRAGATGIVAAAVAAMTIGGGALISDHVWLVDQRDVTKNASEAAGLAATLAMNELLAADSSISDADLEAALQPVAERYVRLNLRHLTDDRLARAEDTLVVELAVDRAAGTVGVSVAADLGGTLLSRHISFAGGYTGPGATHSYSEAEKMIGAVEVVLAIDTSVSMGGRLDGSGCCSSKDPDRRMAIVKNAAHKLVEILDPNEDGQVAVGVVPWHRTVKLDATDLARWASNRWAIYPTERVYGIPYECAPRGNCVPPHSVVQQLPLSAPEPWLGCLDDHRMSSGTGRVSVPSPRDFFTLPSPLRPFAQGYYLPLDGGSYECLHPPPADFRRMSCHSRSDLPFNQYAFLQPQFGCRDALSPILPLTSDRARIENAIDALTQNGDRTHSALGVLWGHRLLMHLWKDVWAGDLHPVDPHASEFTGVRKAIVLLTDGEDSHCGIGNVTCDSSLIGISRTEACAAAKAGGSEIFVVAAMLPSEVSSALGDSLRECSSESDQPDGTYAFLNNADPQALENAFVEIATQLMSARRVL